MFPVEILTHIFEYCVKCKSNYRKIFKKIYNISLVCKIFKETIKSHSSLKYVNRYTHENIDCASAGMLLEYANGYSLYVIKNKVKDTLSQILITVNENPQIYDSIKVLFNYFGDINVTINRDCDIINIEIYAYINDKGWCWRIIINIKLDHTITTLLRINLRWTQRSVDLSKDNVDYTEKYKGIKDLIESMCGRQSRIIDGLFALVNLSKSITKNNLIKS